MYSVHALVPAGASLPARLAAQVSVAYRPDLASCGSVDGVTLVASLQYDGLGCPSLEGSVALSDAGDGEWWQRVQVCACVRTCV